MGLNGLLFEYHSNDICKSILLETRRDKVYLLYFNGNETREIDITHKIDDFCEGVAVINIAEWNLKNYDYPMHFFPSFYWELLLSTDDMYVVCKGENNFPANWKEFTLLLRKFGIVDREFPFAYNICRDNKKQKQLSDMDCKLMDNERKNLFLDVVERHPELSDKEIEEFIEKERERCKGLKEWPII